MFCLVPETLGGIIFVCFYVNLGLFSFPVVEFMNKILFSMED